MIFPVRKYTALAALLSVFYLAIGAYAIHPYFHDHPHTRPHAEVLHSPSQLLATEHCTFHVSYSDEPGIESGEAHHFSTDTQFQQHPCPLCDFLSTSQLLTFPVKTFSFHVEPVGQTLLFYQSVVGLTPFFSFFVRGPPSLFC